MSLRFLGWMVIMVLSACSSAPTQLPRNASVGAAAHAWPSSAVAQQGSTPKILAMHFSSLDIARGETWNAQFVTSTNTASMEVRTNLFAINVPRLGPGRFAFTVNVLDLPPIFLRAYRLRIIARNTEGIATEEDTPFRIR